jgi:hypothetical protein
MTNPTVAAALDLPHPRPTPAPGDEPAPTTRPPWCLRTLTMLFAAESLALALLQLPLSLDLLGFAAMDQGANLRIQSLLDRGLTPAVDFGYQYGLLTLLIGRSWFALLGRTPQAYVVAMVVVDLLIAWGLARCAAALRAGPAGIALIVCTMSGTTLGSYINFAHAFEAVLICHALADHASGRRSRALVLLTVCLFIKPVMAYVYGLLLVLLILRAGGFRSLVRAAVPAAAVGALLAISMAAWFGPEPVVHTLLPLRGAQSYRIVNYGFFSGIGRRFWLPEEVTASYYLFSHAGHYLLASVVLAAALAASAWRLVRASAAGHELNTEVVICCGIMHLAFLTRFYGDFASYTYYYYILIIGLVAMSAGGRRWAIAIAVLAMAALIGGKYWGANIKHHWRDTRPAAETFGLWTDAACREEWHQVRRILGDKGCVLLTTNGGCLDTLMPRFAAPEDVFFTPGWPLPDEIRRKRQRVAEADFVLVHAMRDRRYFFLDRWPEFLADLDGCELVWAGKRFNFLLYRRLRPPKSPPAVTGQESTE